MAPLITIFVRHSPGCKWAGEEFHKGCRCRKHMRWSQNGKQFRKSAGTRSWAEAEEQKKRLEDQLAGRQPEPDSTALMLDAAIQTFHANKQAQGVKPRVRAMYARELKRLLEFSERKSRFTVAQALTLENLMELRATWNAVYKSSYSRSTVQKHLNHFLRFCYNAGWIPRIPRLSTIKITEPKTQPLTEPEYKSILDAAKGKIRVLIELMRWSGLAIRDAATLKREDVLLDEKTGMHRIIRERTKTGTPLYIPIPADVAAKLSTVANGNPVYVFWDKQSATSSEYRQAGYMGEQIKAAFELAGVQSDGHMVSHRLRATFAVDLLQKGVPLEHVSKLLGHKSVKTTEAHYAEWTKGRQDTLDAVVSATWKK